NYERVDAMLKERGLENLLPQHRNGRHATDDAEITTRIDVSDFIDVKRRALRCHRSQTAGSRWEKLPEDVLRLLYREETFARAASLVEAPAQETDLFAGLRDQAIPASDYSLLFAQPVGTHFVAC